MTLFRNNWEGMFFILVALWYVAIPLGITLMYLWVRWLMRTHLWEVKLGYWMLSLILPILGLVFIGAGVVGVNEVIRSKIEQHRLIKVYKAHTWVLQDSAVVAGIHLAPGTKIHFNYDQDMNHKEKAQLSDISALDLSAPTKIFGLTLHKRFTTINGGWKTYLPFDQEISGWPIKKGRVLLTEKGQLKEGYSAKPYVLFQYKIPAESLISLQLGNGGSYYIGTADSSFVINKKTGKLKNPLQ